MDEKGLSQQRKEKKIRRQCCEGGGWHPVEQRGLTRFIKQPKEISSAPTLPAPPQRPAEQELWSDRLISVLTIRITSELIFIQNGSEFYFLPINLYCPEFLT